MIADGASSKKRNGLLIAILILLTIGLIFISISSTSEAAYTAGDKLFFIKKQLIWTFIGLTAFFISSNINIQILKKLSTHIFVVTNILLVLILIPKFGNQALGARRWLDLGFIGIQPSEIFKLSAIIFFAKTFSNDINKNIKTLITYLAVPLGLIILEPNLSTAILICAIVVTIYYISGGEIISLFLLCTFAVLVSVLLVFSSPYRLARLSASYHSNQMILAITSGHLLGKGFANSETKYRYLPKISTDSILAVIGEELGFVGMIFIIYLYFFLTSTIFKISQKTTDPFSSLFTVGIAAWISYQSLINISAVVSLIPLTGVPLPLISYGGSSLVSLLFALGFVQNIQKQQQKLIYSNTDGTEKEHHHHRDPSHSRH